MNKNTVINKRGRLFRIPLPAALFIWMVLIVPESNVHAQPQRWTLQTQDTKMVLGLDPGGALRLVELSNPVKAFNWAKASSPLRLVQQVDVDGQRFTTSWKYESFTIDSTDGRTLTVHFTNDHPALRMAAVWEAKKGRGPVRQSLFLTNNSEKPVTVYNQESIDLELAGPANKTSVVYINDDASLPDSIGVYDHLLNMPFRKDLRISEVQDWIPFVALHDGNSYGMYIGWEWSIGRLSIEKKDSRSLISLKAGNGPDFRTNIPAGETLSLPPGFIGAYAGDLDAGGNSLRKYLFHHSMPDIIKKDSSFPKVEWNAFAALGKEQGGWDPVESKYYPLIDDIAPLGFEEIVIDVGWWTSYGDPGHIIPDSVDWPRGIVAAARYAKDRGMRFGLYDNESENLTSDSGKSERFRDISYLIKNLQADYYRSDATAGPIASGAYGRDHRAGYKEDVPYWSIKGFYEVIDSLYKTLPGFAWENCSNGGGLKDYGAIRRAARIQNQDVYYPVQARRSFFDASHALHPMQIAALVGSWKPWQACGSVYEFRSASMGSSYWHPDAPNGGNGGPVWTAKQKADISKAVSTYKEKLRPLIRHADLYHIFPRPDSVHWDGVQYFDPVTQKGVVYIFKPEDNGDTYTIRLKGLNPSAYYRLSFEDGTNQTTVRKGEALMKAGIKVSLPGALASELMFIEKAKGSRQQNKPVAIQQR